jgi:hypothetical protein
MLVEPCGGLNCVSMVNSTYMRENEPAQKYDFSQCGMVNYSGHSISNKALQLKVSTGVKNTLRPAEYPWLVSLINYQMLFFEKKRVFFVSGSY